MLYIMMNIFNLSYARKNIFTSPDYVTVKTDNIDIPYKRISKNHFESGDYCGTTSGMKWYHNPIDNKTMYWKMILNL